MTDKSPADAPVDADAASRARPGPRGVALVVVGGAAGTLARYGLDMLIGSAAGLPLGIFVINVTGAFLLGVLIEMLALSGPDRGRRRDLRLLLGTGLLGGYTTYSLLATDIASLAFGRHIVEAIGYGLATVLVGTLASWAGILVARARRADS